MFQKVHIAPLITFRIIFGLVMLASIVRFYTYGWIESLYINPTYHFTYYGFEWVKALDAIGMYLIFGILALSCLFIALGFLYRLSAITFFLSFTYIELIDKTTYLNHYYFISVVGLLLIFVPANRYFSLDVLLKPQLERTHVPAWTINIFKLQLGIVYFYAGIAKIHSEWLFDAMPLKIWLPSNSHLPFIGWLFKYKFMPYVFAWTGMLYDLLIPFVLLNGKFRWMGYVAVVVFHILTAMMFNIGMFPYIMIGATLIFFSENFHQKIINFLSFNKKANILNEKSFTLPSPIRNFVVGFLILHFSIQLLFPFRYLAYPKDLFWHEQGFRFSWRVMLIEKMGHLNMKIKNPKTGHQFEINNHDYLTRFQEKMTSTQPDMIIQYAQILKKEFENQGIQNPIITADCYVTLNGRPSQLLIDPTIDLTKLTDGFSTKKWILPLK